MPLMRALFGMTFAWTPLLLDAATLPAEGPPSSIGTAANGCLQGAVSLPLAGSGWQVLRPDHNRFWGNPILVGVITAHAQELQPYGSLLVGDMSLPRGGRMPSGHASHQTGLDADILFRLSDHPLTTEERDDPDFTGVLDHGHVVTARWGEAQWAALKSFASDQRIERVFVNPAIKKYLCLNTQGDRSWLHHVRPWWGHEAHFHIRLNCPEGNSACEPGPKIPEGDGCGADLDWWFTKEAQPAAPLAKPAPPKPPPPIPAACRAILAGK